MTPQEAHLHPAPSGADAFPTETAGLPDAGSTTVVRLADGDTFDLAIHPVRKRIGDDVLRMLSYNGSIPGPTLHVDQGSTITVVVANASEDEATVHWHGLRLENRYDGVPHETQAPIPAGGTFTYELQLPDAGCYWYHPHVREDYGLEMGLYGVIIVEPRDASYWPPVDRHLAITVDDLLVEDGQVPPFTRSGPNFTAMGRFGNVMLTNGETELAAAAAVGEVVRLYLVNTANTRIFNLALDGARMKLVGGDSGRYEREAFVEDVLLAPSERAVVDVLFDRPGEVRLEHRAPDRTYRLGSFTVEGTAAGSTAATFEVLRVDPDLHAVHQAIDHDVARAPDKVLAFSSRMSDRMDHGGMEHGGMHDAGGGDGLEWEDLMPEVNRRTDATTMAWEIVDRETGAVNGAIRWAFTVGDRVKIRLVNELESDHPMHHPFHVHGAGRFLVLARDGAPEPNLVWKDTVLVPAGRTVDILLEVSNPGLWMAHCHIAEHAQSGMMFSFEVARRAGSAPAGH